MEGGGAGGYGEVPEELERVLGDGGVGGGRWRRVGGGCRRGCGEGCPDSLTAAQKVVKLGGGGC